MLTFLQVAVDNWDRILAIAFTIFGTLMTVIAYLFKRRMEAYDKHLEECAKRAIATGRIDERMRNVETGVNWLCNCVISIGVKLGADLPNRPDNK